MSPFRRVFNYFLRRSSPAYVRSRGIGAVRLSDPRTLDNRIESRGYRARGGLR